MKFRHLFALAMLASLAGCSTVYVTGPVGDQPVKLDPDQINGTWTWETGAVTVKVTDAAKGELLVGWIDDGDKDHPLVLRTTTAYVRKVKDMKLVTVQTPKEDKASAAKGPMCFFGAIKYENSKGWLWYPDADAIGELIKTHQIPGRTDNEKNVILDKLSTRQMESLADVKVLAWDHPFDLKKVN